MAKSHKEKMIETTTCKEKDGRIDNSILAMKMPMQRNAHETPNDPNRKHKMHTPNAQHTKHTTHNT